MTVSTRKLSQAAALALLISVATQISYIAISNAGGEPDRPLIWGAEALAFAVIAFAGLALSAQRPLIGAGLALGGAVNLVQVGLGIFAFGPLGEGGEALAPAFQAVLAFAFFLYFAGKAAFGAAAIASGGDLWRAADGTLRYLGALTILAGIAALALNGAAMVAGMDPLLFPAGAAGTLAALLLALTLLLSKPAEPV